MAVQPPPDDRGSRTLSPARLLAFGVVTTLVGLGVANWLVERTEDAGLIETIEPGFDVQLVLEPLFERAGDRWETTDYAERSLVPSSFAIERGAGPRIAVVGGSFAMGTPYRFQGGGLSGGGIASFVAHSLHESGTPDAEVLNLGAAAQDSNRVAHLAATALEHDLDALVVATCNNEGAPPPSATQRALLSQGGVRLLQSLVRSRRASTWYSAQDEDTVAIRQAFVDNLEAIARRARRQDVPVLLATLPVHLRYEGFDLGHLLGDPGLDDPDWELLIDGLASEPEPLPAGWLGMPVCRAGVQLGEAGEHEASLPLLQRCLLRADEEPQLARVAGPYLARAWLERGQRVELARTALAQRLGGCVADAIAERAAGRPEAASAALDRCGDDVDVGEVLRWRGLLADGGAEADALLRQSIELKPRNRCRPTFNEAVRQVAARHEHVTLVDLERSYEVGRPPSGGPAWFLDYCHMAWEGYAAMGREVIDGLRSTGAHPALTELRPANSDSFRARFDLPDGGAAEQVRRTLRLSER